MRLSLIVHKNFHRVIYLLNFINFLRKYEIPNNYLSNKIILLQLNRKGRDLKI